MAKGPEANLWYRIRSNLPEKTFSTRIENKHGGGVPDVHLVWDGIPFWLELKVTKANAVRVTPHQIAWHMAYHARGGKSFFLVQGASTSDLYLFGGDQGPALLALGLGCGGSRFEDFASLFAGLRVLLLAPRP